MSGLEWYLLVLAVVMFLAKFAIGTIMVENGSADESPGALIVLFLMFVTIDIPLVFAATQNVTVVQVKR